MCGWLTKMKCNGCGRELYGLGGFLGYGSARISGAEDSKRATANYIKTLCPRCSHVMKDILLRSDLSEQWENYGWEAVGPASVYQEPYDDD